MNRYLVDKEFKEEAFTKEGYRWDNVFYIPYRFNKDEDTTLIVTETAPLFIETVICRNKWESKTKRDEDTLNKGETMISSGNTMRDKLNYTIMVHNTEVYKTIIKVDNYNDFIKIHGDDLVYGYTSGKFKEKRFKEILIDLIKDY